MCVWPDRRSKLCSPWLSPPSHSLSPPSSQLAHSLTWDIFTAFTRRFAWSYPCLAAVQCETTTVRFFFLLENSINETIISNSGSDIGLCQICPWLFLGRCLGFSCVWCFSLNACLLLEMPAFPSFFEQCSFFTLKTPSSSFSGSDGSDHYLGWASSILPRDGWN